MSDPLTLERLYAARIALDIAKDAVAKAVAQISVTHIDDRLEDLLAELKQCAVLLSETRSYAREEYDDKRNCGGQP